MTVSVEVLPENFNGTKKIYDEVMADNINLHDYIYPHVFGVDQYIGQFSDNSRDELELMGQLMTLAEGSQVLDIGCGRGNVAFHMAKKFKWQLTGIDLSEIPVNSAAKRYKDIEPSIQFINGSVYDLPTNSYYDGLYGTGAFCHFDAKRLFKHSSQLLKTGGKLAFLERTRLGDISSKDWQKLTTQWCCPSVYSAEEYVSLLNDSGFSICHKLDLTDTFKSWQERSVTVRKELKDEIIHQSSIEYFEQSLAFAQYENDVTQSGALGYACIVAEKE